MNTDLFLNRIPFLPLSFGDYFSLVYLFQPVSRFTRTTHWYPSLFRLFVLSNLALSLLRRCQRLLVLIRLCRYLSFTYYLRLRPTPPASKPLSFVPAYYYVLRSTPSIFDISHIVSTLLQS